MMNSLYKGCFFFKEVSKTYEANEAACDVVKDYIELAEYRYEHDDRMYEAACDYIEDYMDSIEMFTNDLYQDHRLFDDSFAEYSYAKWAASEILNALKKNRAAPPIRVIERFKQKALKYAGYNEKAKVIFSIAIDAADEIIDELIAT